MTDDSGILPQCTNSILQQVETDLWKIADVLFRLSSMTDSLRYKVVIPLLRVHVLYFIVSLFLLEIRGRCRNGYQDTTISVFHGIDGAGQGGTTGQGSGDFQFVAQHTTDKKCEALLMMLHHRPTIRFMRLSVTLSVTFSCFSLTGQVGGVPDILSGQGDQNDMCVVTWRKQRKRNETKQVKSFGKDFFFFTNFI
jgi:hypothetical protein